MCTVLLTSLRRVLSTFVLVCFLWTTLFQSFAFAGYERTFGDPTLIEQRGDTHFAHFSVGFQKMEDVPTQNDPALHAQFFPKKSPTLIIPIVRNEAHAELLFDQAFSDTPHILPTVVDGGLSFASGELDFYRENTSGDLVVSKTDVPHAVRSSPLHIYNDHGSTILDTDLPLDHLILSGKDVIQRGKQDIASLLLGIQGRFLNQEKFSVGKLVFDSVLSDTSAETSRESSRAPSPAFSTHSGVSTASSHSLGFANESNMTVREETAFGLAYPIQNSGTWVFHKDAIYSDDILLNETDTSVMEYHQALKGTLHTLHNQGDFHVHGGFDDLQIQEFSNSGRLHGSGQLTLGTHEDDEDLLSINTGHILTDHLQLKLLRDFENRGTIQADTHLHTHGDVTFYQRGTLSGKAITINNRTFLNEASVDSPSLDLTFDENVETFHNAEDVTLATQSLTFSRSTHETTNLVNEGTINTKRFANAQNSLTNKHQITIDVWDQRGNAVTNAPGGMIDVTHDAHFETDQMDNGGDVTLAHASGRLDHLTNIGGFTVQSGGLTCKTLRNARTLSLLDGEYQIDHLNNTGGVATIDQLSLLSEFPTLSGTLTVHHFKPTQTPYTHITVDGTVDLQSGGFTTKALSLKGTLTLEKGRYYIDHFTGDKGAKLVLKRGATVVIGNTEYDGDVISEVRLDLNLTHDKNASHVTALRRDYTARKTAFNALPTATPLKKPLLEETVFDTTKRINDAMSDYHRFDPTRSCDLNELQSRFKMRMGTEVTRIIYEPHRRDALDIQKTLPVLSSTDKLFGHFEITRLSSKVSHDIIQKITTDGMDILDSLSFYVPSFDDDFGVIKRYRHDLTRDMFMLWLRDVLDEHDEGFTPYKFIKPSVLPPPPPPKESKQTGPFKTFRAPQSRPGNVTDLLSHHKERETAFNDVLKEASTAATSVLEKTVLKASSNIVGILGQVSSRHATDHEKKSILQTVMGSEITKVLHNETNQQEIDLETHLPTVDKAHWSYRHFEILRLTAKVSRLLVQHVSGHGYDALAYVSTLLPEFDVDTDTLCTYSGIKRDLFLLWFREILEQHEDGFNHVTRASLTFLSPHTSRSGTIRAAKHVTLTASPDAAPEWAANFLKKHRDTLKIDVRSGLTIETETFLNPHELDLPYPLYISGAFINHRILRTKGLFHNGSFFQNGTDNNYMGTIECDGEMHIYPRYDADLRFSILQSTKKGIIQSQQGNILIGARKNLDGNGNITQNKEQTVTVVKNGAILSSNEELILRVLQKSIVNHFGVVHSGKSLQFIGTKLENVSAECTSDGGIIVDVEDFDHLILDEIYHYSTGKSGEDGGTYQQMFWRTQGWGPWRESVPDWETKRSSSGINGQRAKAESSKLKAKSSIIIKSKNAPTVFASHFASNGSILWHHHDGYLIEVPNGASALVSLGEKQLATFKTLSLNDYFTSNGGNAGEGNRNITPTFASAEGIRINLPHLNMLLEAAMSGKHITLTAHGLQIVNGSGYRKPTKQTATLIDVKKAAEALYKHAPLTNKSKKDGTTHYARNVPGNHPTTYAHNIAVLPLLRKQNAISLPRSLTFAHPPHMRRPNVMLDDATLEDFFMHAQLEFTGRLNERGAGFPAYCIQNGHKLASFFQRSFSLGKSIEEHELMKHAKEPALFYWPGETTDILDFFFPANMNMPYSGTSGNIQASDRVEVLTDEGGIHEDGATIGSGKGGIHYKTLNGGNRTAKSQTRRTYTGSGHVDSIAVSTLLEATDGDIYEDIDGTILLNGAVEYEAGKGTTNPHTLLLKGKEGVVGVETTLEQHSVTHVNRGKVRGTVTETIARPVTASFKSSGNTLIQSANSKVYLAAPTFDAPLGTIVDGKLGAELGEVHTTHSRQESLSKSGNGFTTQSKNIQHTKQESRSQGAVSRKGAVLVRSDEGDATVTNVQIDHLTLEAANGLARVLLGTNYFFEQEVITGKSKIYQSVSATSARHDTFSESSIKNLVIKQSLETVVQTVQGRIPEFIQRIQNNGGKLTYDFVNEIHESTHFEHESLVPEAALVLSLAAAIATYGACSWLGGYAAASAGMTTTAAAASTATGLSATTGCIAAAGSATATLTTAGSIAAGMMAAGLSTLTSQAIITLANNKGDVGKTLKDMNKSDTLKSVGISMSVAGLVGGGVANNAGFVEHLTHQALRMSAQMGMESVIQGRTDGKQAGLTALASTFVGYTSSQIGTAYTKGDFGYITHKFMHLISGAIGGTIMGGKEGAIAGAIGAVGVEVIADALTPTGGLSDDPNRTQYTDEQIQRTKDAARFTVVLLGLAAGLSAEQLSTELTLATIAVENNFEQSAKSLKKGQKDKSEEEANDAELSFLSHLQETTGEFTVICDDEGRPLTPRTIAARKAVVQFELNYAKADQHQREIWRQSGYTAQEAANNAYRGEQMQLGESFLAKAALGEELTPYEQKVKNDFLADRSVEGAAPLVFAKLGSAFTRIKEAIKGKTIHTTSASSVLEKGSTLNPKAAVNSNVPIKPTANNNVMPLPHVVETTEVNGIQKLAQQYGGGARTTKDYRQIYFSAERSGAQGLGSNGTLTMDGGTRTLNSSKTGSGKLVLDSSGNGSGSLGVFRQNAEGRWLLSAGERVSAKDLVQRPVDLIETTERTLASWEGVKLDKLKDSLLKGEYGKVKGHHVHAKKAFEGHVNYDPKKGFSISREFMDNLRIDHSKVTGTQKKLFTELAKSGRPNTIYEHTRIAVDSLIQNGVSRDIARSIVAESLASLRIMNVRNPVNIPWN